MSKFFVVRDQQSVIKAVFVDERKAIEYVKAHKLKLMKDYPTDPMRIRSEEYLINPVESDIFDYIRSGV